MMKNTLGANYMDLHPYLHLLLDKIYEVMVRYEKRKV